MGYKEQGATKNYITGLELSPDVSDVNNRILIAIGECGDENGVYMLRRTTTLVKRLDVSWAVGNNAGGLDTGAKGASTAYYVFLIRRLDTGVVDALFSLSATSPTMPANYTVKRRIGIILTNGSSNIRQFTQDANVVMFNPPLNLINQTAAAQQSNFSLPNMPTSLPLEIRGILFATSSGSNNLSSAELHPPSFDPGTDLNINSGGVTVTRANAIAMGSHVTGAGSGQGDYASSWFKTIMKNGQVLLKTTGSSISTVMSLYGWTDITR